MMQAANRVSLCHRVLLGSSLAALAAGALLAGCRGNTTAAAPMDRKPGNPPNVTAQRTAQDLTGVDPSMSPVWAQASWQLLVAPINATHMPPPARAAFLFDDANLYLAAICELPPTAELTHDAISLYLDPTGQGREILQITTDAEGQSQCTWIRSAAPMQPLDDGAPDNSHPLDVRPNIPINGLVAKTFSGISDGKPVWRLALTLPAATIPSPMRAKLGAGSWRFNVLRSLSSIPGQPAQSNLAPIYMNSQAQSPYRMAFLQFAPK